MSFSSTSHLVEPGIKAYLNESLKKCHKVKVTYYSYWFNTVLFLGFVAIFGGFLLSIWSLPFSEDEVATLSYFCFN